MKKLFTLLAVLFALNQAVSQNTYTLASGKVTLLDAEPSNSVCIGDSVKIYFKFLNTFPDTVKKWTFCFWGNDTKDLYYTMKKCKYTDFYSMSKELEAFSPFDTVYSTKIRAPHDFEPPVQIFVCMQGKNSTSSVYFLTKPCIIGIEEYELNGQIPVYYDLRGNIIDRRSNELIIEQVGVKRRKIIIQEK